MKAKTADGYLIMPYAIVKGENHLPKGTKIDSGELVQLQLY